MGHYNLGTMRKHLLCQLVDLLIAYERVRLGLKLNPIARSFYLQCEEYKDMIKNDDSHEKTRIEEYTKSEIR